VRSFQNIPRVLRSSIVQSHGSARRAGVRVGGPEVPDHRDHPCFFTLAADEALRGKGRNAARSSLSSLRITILIASSGNGRCRVLRFRIEKGHRQLTPSYSCDCLRIIRYVDSRSSRSICAAMVRHDRRPPHFSSLILVQKDELPTAVSSLRMIGSRFLPVIRLRH
jgi:hypothetical protein